MIAVNSPPFNPQSVTYAQDALHTNWISSNGKYIGMFEDAYASYVGVRYAASCINGTAALHLALDALGIGEGDEVIIPDLTIISCAFSALYVRAKPVLVDVEDRTGNIDPSKIEQAITPKTKAIMVVHLYGHPVDFDPIHAIAKKHGLIIIEDAAEAHGALYKNKKVGSLGDIACFSFYANKIVTTGEGGMVVSNNAKYIESVKQKRNLSHKIGMRFLHEELGYNYRMTNIQAAIGLGHLESIDTYIRRKKHIAGKYNELLKGLPHLELPVEKPYADSVYWMYTVLVGKNSPLSRDDLMKELSSRGIETRSYFYPLHIQPVLTSRFQYNKSEFPVSRELSQRGLYIPSGLGLTDDEIVTVSKKIYEIFRSKS